MSNPKRSPRTILVAIVSGLCGIAGTLATVLPDGEVQRGAAQVATTCEANGFRAWPEAEKPAPAVDAGTPASTSPAPVLEAPQAPSRSGYRAELAPSVGELALVEARAELPAPLLVLVPFLPQPRWRGEWMGWA